MFHYATYCATPFSKFAKWTIFNYRQIRTPRPKDAQKYVEESIHDDLIKADLPEDPNAKPIDFKPTVQWKNVFVNLFVHFGAFVGVYHMITLQPKFQTYIWCKFFSFIFNAKQFSWVLL